MRHQNQEPSRWTSLTNIESPNPLVVPYRSQGHPCMSPESVKTPVRVSVIPVLIPDLLSHIDLLPQDLDQRSGFDRVKAVGPVNDGYRSIRWLPKLSSLQGGYRLSLYTYRTKIRSLLSYR